MTDTDRAEMVTKLTGKIREAALLAQEMQGMAFLLFGPESGENDDARGVQTSLWELHRRIKRAGELGIHAWLNEVRT